MEVLGAASALAFQTAMFNRGNFMFDIEQQQTKRFKALQFRIQRFAQYREDISDLLPPITNITNSVTKWSVLMLTTAVTLLGTAELREEDIEGELVSAADWIRSIWMTSTVASIGFLFISKWLAYHAVVSAQCYATKMLLHRVRLPLPTKDELEQYVQRASDFEGEKAKDVLRVPVVQKKVATKEEKEPHADAAEIPLADVDHIALFRQLRLQWRTYEVYTRMCLSAGVVSLFQGLCFYLIAYNVMHIGSWYAACACVVLLCLCAYNIMSIDLIVINWSCVVYVAGPFLVLASFWIKEYFIIPIAFASQALWPLVFLSTTRRKRDNSPSLWRFVRFIDVFHTFGGRKVLDPAENEVYQCIDRLVKLERDCTLHLKDKNLTARERYTIKNASIIIQRSLVRLRVMLPKQKAPIAGQPGHVATMGAANLKDLALKEEALVGHLEDQFRLDHKTHRDEHRFPGLNAPLRSLKVMCFVLSAIFFANFVFEVYKTAIECPFKPNKGEPDPKKCSPWDHKRRRLVAEDRWGMVPRHARFHSCDGEPVMHNTTHVFEFHGTWHASRPFEAFGCDGQKCAAIEKQETVALTRRLKADPGTHSRHFSVVDGDVIAYEGYTAYASFQPFPKTISCSTFTHGNGDMELAVLGENGLVKVLDAQSGRILHERNGTGGNYVDICLHERKVYLLSKFSKLSLLRL